MRPGGDSRGAHNLRAMGAALRHPHRGLADSPRPYDRRPDRTRPAHGCGGGEVSASHVVDRDGNVWAVVRDGGMVTRADHSGPISAGIAWLESEAGPLLPFDPIAYRRSYPRAEL
jgi:hypothetical protein